MSTLKEVLKELIPDRENVIIDYQHDHPHLDRYVENLETFVLNNLPDFNYDFKHFQPYLLILYVTEEVSMDEYEEFFENINLPAESFIKTAIDSDILKVVVISLEV